MTCHFVGLAHIMELRFARGIGAYIRPTLRLIYRAAWGETAAAERALEIKHAPIARRFWRHQAGDFAALFGNQ